MLNFINKIIIIYFLIYKVFDLSSKSIVNIKKILKINNNREKNYFLNLEYKLF
jgi:hypothetical protein